jgi:Cdc6-like AAA superfamily ATPase
MKFELVSTRNVDRMFEALNALEARLSDPQIMGMGLIYGRPGLGKSMATDMYVTRKSRKGVRCVKLRAMAHWTETSMIKDVLKALGPEPRAYRTDIMMEQITETLRDEKAIIIIDEMDAIAGSRKMIAILKDVHDVTESAIMMIGEERVDGLLRRYESFYNRMNISAVVHVASHREEDVAAVIDTRCEYSVDRDVCSEIYALTGGRSMRSVVDKIREMEAYASVNGLSRIGAADYRKMGKSASLPVSQQHFAEAVNG